MTKGIFSVSFKAVTNVGFSPHETVFKRIHNISAFNTKTYFFFEKYEAKFCVFCICSKQCKYSEVKQSINIMVLKHTKS